MVSCRNCGCEIPEGSKFCKECGFEVIAEENQFCSNCGYKMPKGAKFCKECGTPVSDNTQTGTTVSTVISDEKNPVLAALLSFFIIGLGQVYLGLNKKGILLFIGAIISGFLMLIIIGFLTLVLIWIYAIYDAYNSAEKINSGIAVEDTIDFNNLF